jgi:hypothetical protein
MQEYPSDIRPRACMFVALAEGKDQQCPDTSGRFPFLLRSMP